MSLLDAFLLQFSSEGLEELADDVKEADKDLDHFEEQAKKTEKQVKKLGETIKKDSNRRFESMALNITRAITPMVVLGKALHQTMQFASEALEVADAAAKARKTLEDFQAQGGNKYQIYTRQDVNNAKDFELTMRDVRMGLASIASNISKMLLPALTFLAKITKKVIDFFVDHGEFIKAAFVGMAIVITAMAIPAIISMGAALWTALAPILPFIAAALALALVFEDLWKWMHGEPSVAELLFGNFENVKAQFLATWENIKSALQPFLEALGTYLKTYWDETQAFFNLIGAIISYVYDKGQPLFDIIGKGLNGLLEIIKNIGKFVLDIVTNFLKVANIIGQISTKGMNFAAEKINGSHADGLDYVPFDGYIAELHRGERVQTADEANDWRSGLMAAKKAINFTASYPLNAIPSGAVSNAYNSSSSNRTINIGDITIQTQATDAQSIAVDFASYIKQAVINLDDGMLA